MKNMKRKVLALELVALLALIAVVSACSKPPQAQIDAATAALDQAVAADAAEYAPEALAKARASVDAMNAELTAQNEKFALLRSYDSATTLAATAAQAAEEANAAVAIAKQQAEDAAVDSLSAATLSIDTARPLLDTLADCRRKPKGFAADLEAMRGSLEGLAALVPAIEADLAAENFSSAQAQADSLDEQAESLVADLEAAKVKIGC
jgi:SWI/SNF-related matrix-associated actin-dependent regulator 1 of chromatin subfamily A